MRGFFKTYFWQLLKIACVVIGIMIGFFLSLYAAVQTFALPKILLETLLILLPVAGFLAGVALPFVVEYRGRLTARHFFTEILTMLVAILFVAAGVAAGIALGVMSVNSLVSYDGTGLAVLFFLGSGMILGSIPGIILAALAITVWKRRSGQQVELT